MKSNKFQKPILRRVISLITLFVSLTLYTTVWSAEISTALRNVLGHQLENQIAILGEIEHGDFEKFRSTVLCEELSAFRVWIVSNGGDVVEALKIGRLVRALGMETVIPTMFNSGQLFSIEVPDHVDQVCASACFFIYVAGVRRDGTLLGIHRPYMSEEAYRKLSAQSALDAGQYFKNEIAEYLNEMGVSQTYLDRMYAIPKNEIEWIQKNEVVHNFDGFIPELSEWADARCGSGTDKAWECRADEVFEFSMNQKKKYLRANDFHCEHSVE
jgi:hypothetical protein